MGIDILAAYYNDVFSSDIAEQLESVQKLLYSHCNIPTISRFYQRFSRITIAGDPIASSMLQPNGRNSSVIMAYRSNRGSTLRTLLKMGTKFSVYVH